MAWITINRVRRLWRTSVWRTIFFNLKMLPFKQAVKFPILLTNNAYFYSLSGKVTLSAPARFGMIRFGYFGEDSIHSATNKTVLDINGEFILSNDVHFGSGLIIRVLPKAILNIENNVRISNRVKIICYKNIHIHHDSRIAWESQILDTSFHYIKNTNDGSISEITTPISIGAHNWIGNRVTIMKGTHTPNYTIVAACSLINKNYEIPEYSLLAGSPAKLIKTGIYRCLDAEEQEIKNKCSQAKDGVKI